MTQWILHTGRLKGRSIRLERDRNSSGLGRELSGQCSTSCAGPRRLGIRSAEHDFPIPAEVHMHSGTSLRAMMLALGISSLALVLLIVVGLIFG